MVGPAGATTRRPWVSNRRLFQVHGWLGINLGLLLFIVCFSGAIATLSHEIEWLLNPAVRAAPPGDTAPFASWTAWYTAVRESHPAAQVLSIDAPDGRRWAARATIAYGDEDWRYVFVDPYSARVNGTFSEFGIPRFFRSFHKQFYIYPGSLPHGVYALGPLGLVLLLSLLTGLSFYRFRWRDLLMLGPWRSPRAFWSALHRATGMWILPMAFLITVTGVWYFVERALEDADVDLPSGSQIAVSTMPSEPTFWPLAIEDAVALARQQVPNLQASAVSFTRGAAPKVTVRGQGDAWLVRDAANSVRIDPYRRHIESSATAAAMTPVARWVHTADPLHFGTFGGLTIRVIWFAAGLITSAAILLGVRVWYLRSIPVPLAASRRRAGLLASVSVTLVVLAVSLYGCLVNIGDALVQEPAASYVSVGAHLLGAASVGVTVSSDAGRLSLRGTVRAEDRAGVRRGWAWIGDERRPAAVPAEAVPLEARWDGVFASLGLPGEALRRTHLWLAAEDRTGTTVMTGVSLGSAASGTGKHLPTEIVPSHVWFVIALFAAACAGVSVAWCAWLQRQPASGRAAALRVPTSAPAAPLSLESGPAKR
jgi:uncharacterized iron-regulated membrane protein